jgi:hypothetical protein
VYVLREASMYVGVCVACVYVGKQCVCDMYKVVMWCVCVTVCKGSKVCLILFIRTFVPEAPGGFIKRYENS